MRNNKLLLCISLVLLFSSSVLLYAEDALSLYSAAKYEEAVNFCLSVLKKPNPSVDNYVYLTQSLLKLERYPEALSYAEAARARTKMDPRVTEMLAEALYFSGRNADALKHFQEYILQAPDGNKIALAFYYSGELYIRSGRFAHADIALTAACTYDPNNAQFWLRLGYARESANDLNYALLAYKRSEEINPSLTDAKLGYERVSQKIAN